MTSEIYEIPGNRNLTPEQREARAQRFYEPFRHRLERTLLLRLQSRRAPILITIHSFTPVFKGKERDIELGILHDDDARLADAMLTIVEREGQLVVGRNQPYGPEDGVTHTLRLHALPLGLLNVMIEIRSDLIDDPGAQRRMAKRLHGYLTRAVASLGKPETELSHA